MITLSFLLILALLLSLLMLLSSLGLLAELMLLLFPAALAVLASRLTLGHKHRLAAEQRSRLESALLNRLSIKRNDLACQDRWLQQLSADDETRDQHLTHCERLMREIALLEDELAALRREDQP